MYQVLAVKAPKSTLHTGTVGISVMAIAGKICHFGLNASYWDRWYLCNGDCGDDRAGLAARVVTIVKDTICCCN